MGATYTRQSTYEDGDTITAAHTNDEFDQLLAAFQASTGHTHDGTANEGGPVSKLLSNTLTFGAATSGTDITITFDGESNDGVLKWMEDEDYFEFSDDILVASTEKIQFRDTAIYINSSTDGQLDLVADTEIQIAATTIDINGNVDVSGTLTVAGALDFGDANITNVGSLALDTITNDGTDITLDSSGDIILDAGGANITFKDDGTSILDIANNSSDVELTVSVADKNFAIKGTDGSSAITALDIDMALAGKATFSGDVVVTGDLTVSGDDITMATNTSGNILVADGTNFNSVAVGDLSAITSVASDDVLLAVDTSGGGLKKITRSALVTGLAAGTMSNIVEDTSPQLGGDLDTNSANILIDDAHFIGDENGNEQIIFQTTGSAVNQFDVTNAATGNPPKISATGGDSNIDFDIEAKGTGHVTIRGNTNPGSIQFNCESNSHGQIVKSQAHSEGVTNVLTLPAGADSTLLSAVSTATLTNKSFGDDVLIKTSDGAILKLQTSDTTVADGDVVGAIEFSAPDESGGTDAITTAASIVAEADATFASDNNQTDLVFKLGSSEAATEKMRLTHEGNLTVSGDATIGDDLILNTDSSLISLGAGADATLTHDGTTGVTIAANPITIDSGGNLNLDAHTGIWVFKDAGSEMLRFTEGNSGDVTIKLATNAKDLVFTDNGDATNMKILDAAAGINVPGEVQTTKIAFTDGDDAITVADGGGITAANGITSTAASNTFGATSFNDANITNVGSIALDSIASDAGTGTAITFGAGNVPNTNTDTSVSGSTAPDFSQYTNFIWTLTGNLVLTDPGDEVAGQSGIFVFIQDGTGSRTLSHAADQYFVAGGTSITLTTTASAVDIVPYFVQADGKIHLGAAQLAFAEA
jgi:hypothetical protein